MDDITLHFACGCEWWLGLGRQASVPELLEEFTACRLHQPIPAQRNALDKRVQSVSYAGGVAGEATTI